jgi:hypothetical protein
MTDPLNGKSVFDTPKLERKAELMEAIMAALAHLPRRHAMTLIMTAWSLEALEAATPALLGPEAERPTLDQAKQSAAQRLMAAATRRRLKFGFDGPFDRQTMNHLALEALWEAQ